MFQEWQSDLKSSLVVFLVALPLCLGISLASNAPMSAGLFAGILGGLVVGSISGSHVGVSGPAAGLTVIVINGIATLGSFETFALAVFLAGVFQILFGLLRAGAIGDFFPTAVIRGMLAAIGMILIIKQFPNALGLTPGWELKKIFSQMHTGVTIISVVSIAIMLVWDKLSQGKFNFFRLVPGALIAVVASVALSALFNSSLTQFALDPNYLVHLPFTGGLSDLISCVKFPDFSQILSGAVFQIALTISIVASIETLLCVDAGDKIDPYNRKTSKDRELLAQGIGNAISGLIGGLPITAVIVRTSANISAGARSKLSAILHSVWLVACIALIPNVLNLIPLSCLACVLLLTGYKLCKPSHFSQMKDRGWDQLLVFSTTIIAILATDLLVGIFVGVLMAILIELNKISFNPYTITHESEKSVIEFSKNVTFFHKAKIQKMMNSTPSGSTLHIKGMTFVKVHVDVHELLNQLKNDLEKKSIKVILHP
jgi:MFS superfamily sulfate permease-like transporter